MSNRIKPRMVTKEEGEVAVTKAEPMSKGIYSTYRTPKGGVHLVYRPEDSEEDQHLEIPPFMIAMAEKAMSGQQLDLGSIAKMMNGGKR